MLFTTVNKLAVNIIVILLIYLLLRVIPKTPLSNRDILISTVALYAIFLVINTSKENMDNMMQNTQAQLVQPTQPAQPAQPPVQLPAQPPAQPAQPAQPVPQPTTIPSVEECSTCKVDLKDNQDVTKTSSDEGNIAFKYQAKYKYDSAGSRSQSGVIPNEMSYTDYNSLPVGANVNSQNSDFSYSFLPPDKWYPVPPHPPVCITEQKCPVCPMTTNRETIDLKEWDDSRRVTPGDVVNTKYINEKLNSGR